MRVRLVSLMEKLCQLVKYADAGLGLDVTDMDDEEMRQVLSKPREPLIHSYITDRLDDSHPLAWKSLRCKMCDCHLHTLNECMRPWVETGKGNYCLMCFAKVDGDVEDDIEDYALPS